MQNLQKISLIDKNIYKDLSDYFFSEILSELQPPKVVNSLYSIAIIFFCIKHLKTDDIETIKSFIKSNYSINTSRTMQLIIDLCDEYIGLYIFKELRKQQREEIKTYGQIIDRSNVYKIANSLAEDLSSLNKSRTFFNRTTNFYKSIFVENFQTKFSSIIEKTSGTDLEKDLLHDFKLINNFCSRESKFHSIKSQIKLKHPFALTSEIQAHLESPLGSQKIVGISKILPIVTPLEQDIINIQALYTTIQEDYILANFFEVNKTLFVFPKNYCSIFNILTFLSFYPEKDTSINEFSPESKFTRMLFRIKNFLEVTSSFTQERENLLALLKDEKEKDDELLKKKIYKNFTNDSEIIIDNDSKEIEEPYSDISENQLINYCYLHAKQSLETLDLNISEYSFRIILYSMTKKLLDLIKNQDDKKNTNIQNYLISRDDSLTEETSSKITKALVPFAKPSETLSLKATTNHLKSICIPSPSKKIDSPNIYIALQTATLQHLQSLLSRCIHEFDIQSIFDLYNSEEFIQKIENKNFLLKEMLQEASNVEYYESFKNYYPYLKRFHPLTFKENIQANPELYQEIFQKIMLLFENSIFTKSIKHHLSHNILHFMNDCFYELNLINKSEHSLINTKLINLSLEKFNKKATRFHTIQSRFSSPDVNNMIKKINKSFIEIILKKLTQTQENNDINLDILMLLIEKYDLHTYIIKDSSSSRNNSYLLKAIIESENPEYRLLADQIIEKIFRKVKQPIAYKIPHYVFKVYYLIKSNQSEKIISKLDQYIAEKINSIQDYAIIDKLDDNYTKHKINQIKKLQSDKSISQKNYLRIFTDQGIEESKQKIISKYLPNEDGS